MIECHFDERPMAYITSMRVLSAISLPVNLFGIYCIAYKSPPFMKEYSRLLLVYQILSTLCDSWANLVYIPITFFPFPIIYHVGLLLPDVSMPYAYMHIVWLCLVVTTMGAVAQLFMFRWQHMHHPLKLRKKVIYAICLCQFILFNAALIAAGLAVPDRVAEMKPFYAKQFTCVADMDHLQGVQYFNMDDVRRFFLITGIEGTALIIATLGFVYLTFRSFHFTNVSQKTINLQKTYQVSLILQMITPIFAVNVPGSTIMMFETGTDIFVAVPYAAEIQVITNIIMCFISIHGLLSTMIMILVNKPYRRFVLDLLRGCLLACLGNKWLSRVQISQSQTQDISISAFRSTKYISNFVQLIFSKTASLLLSDLHIKLQAGISLQEVMNNKKILGNITSAGNFLHGRGVSSIRGILHSRSDVANRGRIHQRVTEI